MRRRTPKFRPFHLANLWEDNPSCIIQEIARSYCEDRPLYRPNTSYIKFFTKWILFVCIVFWGSFFSISLAAKICIPRFLPKIAMLISCDQIEGTSIWLFSSIVTFVILCLTVRWFAIDCIRLYQHYAPEQIRRRCILMPSCSEFAILAIKRYGFILGCIMAYYRLNFRCRGNINRIEYP